MGNNFWLKINVCDKCGREDHKIHIGKANWERKFVFVSKEGLQNKEQWLSFLKEELKDSKNKIVDSVGETINLEELIEEIEHSKIYKSRYYEFDSDPDWRSKNFYTDDECDYLKGEDWS